MLPLSLLEDTTMLAVFRILRHLTIKLRFSENLTSDFWGWGHWDSDSAEIFFTKYTYGINFYLIHKLRCSRHLLAHTAG